MSISSGRKGESAFVGAISRTKASLRFFGDQLDPDEITRVLGKVPTIAEKKGQAYRRRSDGRKRVARVGTWRLRANTRAPGDLSGQIEDILLGMTDDLEVWAELSARFRIDLFCGLFMEDGNEGEQLEPEALRKLAERNIPLALDIYGPD